MDGEIALSIERREKWRLPGAGFWHHAATDKRRLKP